MNVSHYHWTALVSAAQAWLMTAALRTEAVWHGIEQEREDSVTQHLASQVRADGQVTGWIKATKIPTHIWWIRCPSSHFSSQLMMHAAAKFGFPKQRSPHSPLEIRWGHEKTETAQNSSSTRISNKALLASSTKAFGKLLSHQPIFLFFARAFCLIPVLNLILFFLVCWQHCLRVSRTRLSTPWRQSWPIHLLILKTQVRCRTKERW